MSNYPEAHRQAVIQKWLDSGLSMKLFSEQENINLSTLYAWRTKYLPQYSGGSDLLKSNTSHHWSSEKKFTVVLETAALSEAELSEYCRKKGIYPEQISQWKQSCLSANQSDSHRKKQQAQERKEDQQRIKQLEKELKRKDAALAETAALLVLRKKLNAYWGVNEES